MQKVHNKSKKILTNT